MKHLVLLISTSLLLISFSFAQQIVSGVVFDSQTGEPLEGTSVMVQGTTIGVLTDANGSYFLKIPEIHKTLIFTHIGKKRQEVPIDGRSKIQVAMMDQAFEVDEVIITAFGIEKDRRTLTSSVQAIMGDELVNSRETNLVNALSAKVAGAQIITSSGMPGAGAGITIRGSASLNGNNQPLFVVDGIPIDNSQITTGQTVLAGHTTSNRAIDLNPNDIEHISVLKGPGAATLYGSRAANGVILISTKSGGNEEDKINFTYQTSLSFDQVNKLPELNQSYAQGSMGLLDLATSTSWGPSLTSLSYDGDNTSNYSPYGNLIHSQDSVSSPGGVEAADPYQFFQQGLKWDNHFSMSGGQTANNFIISISDTRQTGIVPKHQFRQNIYPNRGSSQY